MSGSVPECRELTQAERLLLDWLIRNGTGDVDELLRQLSSARVVSRCGCGCPTVDLSVGDREVTTTGGSQIVADAQGSSPQGVPIEVILHVRDGLLSELEAFAMNGYGGPFTIPEPSALRFH
jgi:hypothetical protein